MDKTLVLIRHGKSDWSLDDLPDYDRPLKSRGYQDAYKMAERLRTYSNPPQIIYTSPANRALYTSIIFSRVLFNEFNRIEIKKEIYLASSDQILNVIQKCDNRVQSIAIFSHNPGITDLSNHFLQWNIDNIPTSGFVRLVFNTENWKEIDKRTLKSRDFDFPKKDLN